MSDTPNFDDLCARFTSACKTAANWKHDFLGAAYSTRIDSAIALLEATIAELRCHPEFARRSPDNAGVMEVRVGDGDEVPMASVPRSHASRSA